MTEHPTSGQKLGAALRDCLISRSEILLGYLFGSQAQKKENPLSDIDVAILVDEEAMEGSYPYGYKARVCTELMKHLKTNRVDVVVLNEAPYFLRHRVIAFGVPILVRSENERIAFEADTMGRYPDIKRLLSIHW